MGIKNDIKKRIDLFTRLCSNHKVKVLYAFGSSVTDRFDPINSDIDLLVEIDEQDPLEKGEKLMHFWDELETFFNKKIDLLTDSSIKNPVLRKSIENSKILIYDGAREKVFV